MAAWVELNIDSLPKQLQNHFSDKLWKYMFKRMNINDADDEKDSKIESESGNSFSQRLLCL